VRSRVMKRVVSLAVVSALLLVGGFGLYKWSGARGEVMKDKVLKKIDSWIGESEVARKEIDRGINGMDVAIEKLTDSRIKAQVQAEMLTKEVKVNRKKIDDSKASLTKIKTDLTTFDTNPTYTVSYGGKTYSKKDDLEKMAAKVIDSHKSLVAQTESMEKRLSTYEATATTLAAREDEAKKKRDELKNRLKELDAKIEMAKAQRDAAAALSETDKTFADSIKGIEEKINKLDLNTETAVRKEEEKWKEITAKTEVEDASKIINNSKSTISEIDALLGNK
jgi:phage shock protein A